MQKFTAGRKLGIASVLALTASGLPLVAPLSGSVPTVQALDPVGLWDCSGIDCLPTSGPYPPLGNGAIQSHDDSINVYVGGNMTVGGSSAESEGLTVVGGDFTLAKSGGSNRYDIGEAGVGSRIVPNPGEDFFVVGGDVTVSPGQQAVAGAQENGVARYAGSLTGDLNTGVSAPPINDPNALGDYAGVPAALTATSQCLAALPATGTALVQFGALQLNGTGTTGLEVFNFAGDVQSPFGGNTGITFNNVSNDATVIINLTGAGTKNIRTYTGGGGGQPDTIRENLLWHIPEATDVNFVGVAQWQGSVLVANPASDTLVNMPGMNGRFYTLGNLDHNSPTSGQEFHSYPWNGNLDGVCTVPPAEDTYDLALQKTINSVNGPLLADPTNGSVTFDLTVTNQDADVQQIEITDYLGIGADIDFEYVAGDQSSAGIVDSGGSPFGVAWDPTNPVVTLTAASGTDTLANGETITVPITLRVASTFDNGSDPSFDNAAEISAFDNDLDGTNPAPTDEDSTPDATDQSNDGETLGATTDLVDDEINESAATGGDEDDHDIASLRWWDVALINTRNASTGYILDTSGATTTATFDIIVKNQGRLTAYDIGVLDQLPAGTSFVSDDTSQFGVTFNAATATTAAWTISFLEPQETATITFTVQVDDDSLGSYENTAEITVFDDGLGNTTNDPGGPFDIDSTPDLDPGNDLFFEDATNADNPRNSHNLIDYDADSDGNVNEIAIDPTTGDEDDHGREVVILPGSFDQALTKTVASVSSTPITVGTEITWDVTITNQGDPVQRVDVTDYPNYDTGDATPTDEEAFINQLPVFTATDSGGTVFNVAIDGNVAILTSQGGGTLDTGETITFPLVTTVAAGWDGSSIVNWAEISRFDDDQLFSTGDSSGPGGGVQLFDIDSTPDGTPGNDNQPANPGDPTDGEIGQDGTSPTAPNDEDDHDVAELPVYDISLIDELASGQAYEISTADTQITFSVTVKNQGDQTVNAIGVTGAAPTGTAYNAAGNTANDAANTKVAYDGGDTFTIDTLAPGQSTTFDITYDITAPQSEYVHAAEVDSFSGDAGVPVALVVDIDSTPGTGDADDIRDDAGIDPNGNDDRNSHNLIDYDRTDPAGANTPIDTTSAAVPAAERDEDDHDREVVVVQEVYDLALAKTLGTAPAPIAAGADITWNITLTNQGDEVQTIDITDYPLYIDATTSDVDENATIGTAPATATDSGGSTYTVTQAGNVVTLVADGTGTFANGETIVLPITTTIAASWDGSDIVNWAEISRFDNDTDAGNGDSSAPGSGEQLEDRDSTPDATPSNDNQPALPGDPTDDEIDEDGSNGGDEDDHDVAVLTVYDVALIKTLADGQADSIPLSATEVAFTITVKNQGPNFVQNIDVFDTIPPGLTYASFDNVAASDDAAVSASTGTATSQIFEIDELEAGESVSFDVTFTVDVPGIATPVEFVNAAEISAVEDALGGTPTDIDSTPSSTDTDAISDAPTGDVRNSHNDIDNDRDGTGNPIATPLDEDDHDREVVARVAQYDLALQKTLDVANLPASIGPGTIIPWLVTITNQGDPVDFIRIVDYPTYNPGSFEGGIESESGPFTDSDGGTWTVAGSNFAVAGTPYYEIDAGAGVELDLGETITIPMRTTVAAGWDGSELINWAEVEFFRANGTATNLTDVDSTPDFTAGNDPNQPTPGGPTDDAIDGDALGNPATDDEDDHDVASVPIYDLSLIKTLGPDQSYEAAADDLSIDFDITVKNQGTATAFLIDVVDYLPAGTTFAGLGTVMPSDDAAVTLGAAGPGTQRMQIDSLDALESVTFTVTLDITDTTAPSFLNIAEIAAFDDDADPGNPLSPLAVDIDSTPEDIEANGPADPVDTSAAIDPAGNNDLNSHNDIDNDRTAGGAPVATPTDEDDHGQEIVVLPYDLALRKTLDGVPGAVTIGNDIAFNVTIFNQGRDVNGIDIADYLGADFAYVAADNTTTGTLTSADGASIAFTLPAADIAANTTLPILLTGALAAGDSVTIPLLFDIVGTGTGTGQIENYAEISRFDNDNNSGNGDSSDGTVVDIDSTPDATDGSNDGETLGADLVDDEITGDRTDDPTADEDDHDVAATRWFDAAVLITREADTPQPYVLDPSTGTVAVEWDIEVVNQGPNDLFLIDVIDTLPDGMTYTSLGTITPSADATVIAGPAGTGTQTFQVDELSPGESVTFTIVTSIAVTAATPDRFVNMVEIARMEGEFDTDNDGTLEQVAVTDIDSVPDTDPDDDAFLATGTVDPDDGPNTFPAPLNGPNPDDSDDADSEAVVMPVDLALRKTFTSVTTPQVLPGGNVQFEIEVFNQGLSPVNIIEVTDYIDPALWAPFAPADNPAGTAGASNGDAWTFGGGTYATPAAAPTYTWSAAGVATIVGDLAPGESVTIPVTLTVAPGVVDPGTLLNVAEISDYDDDSDLTGDGRDEADSTPDGTDETNMGETDGGDLVDDEIDESGDAGDDEDDHDIAGIPVYDLSLINTLAGGQDFRIDATATTIEFDITVKNQGDEIAYVVDVIDHLPAGTTFDSLGAQSTSGDAAVTLGAAGIGSQAFQIDRLDPQETATFTVVLNLDDTSIGEYLNQAEIASFDDDTDATNGNSQGATPTVTDIDSVPDDVVGNDIVNTDTGVDPAANDDRNSHNDIDNDRDDPAGANTPIVPLVADDDDHGQELVVMAFDLALRKTLDGVAPAVVQNGTKIDFLVTVINQGRDVAEIDLADYVGDNFTYLPADNSTTTATSADGATITYGWQAAAATGGDTVAGQIVSPLAAGDSVDIPITLTVAIADPTQQLVNFAEISRFDDDNDDANGDSTTTLVDDDSTPDDTDGNGAGEDPATDQEDDQVDEDGTPGNDEDDHDGAEVRWFDAALLIERSATQDYVVDPTNGTIPVNWDITVANQGPNDLFQVEVIDRLPAGMTYDSLVTPPATVLEGTDGPGTQVFEIPSLPTGETVTFTILTTVPVGPTTPGRFVNDAEISVMRGLPTALSTLPVDVSDIDSTPDTAPGDPFTDGVPGTPGVEDVDDGPNVLPAPLNGPNPTDEDDADTEAIVMPSDLALTKVFDASVSEPTLPDGEIRFDIEVFNQGLTTVNVVEVTDYLQPGFTFDIADNGGGPSGPSTGQSWVLGGQAYATPATAPTFAWAAGANPTAVVTGAIAPGESVTVPIVLTIVADTDVTTLLNKAEISDFDVDGDLTGDTPPETDSTPDDTDDDNQPANPGDPTDDEIDDDARANPADDEDDHDIAGVPIYDVSLIIDRSPTQTYVVGSDDQVRWDVTVRNQGTAGVQDVLVNVEQQFGVGALTTDGAATDAGLPTGFLPGPTIAVTRAGDDYTIDELLPGEEVTFTIVTDIVSFGADGRIVQQAEVAEFFDLAGNSSLAVDGPEDVDSIADVDMTNDDLNSFAGTPDVVDSHNDIVYDPDGDGNVNELTPGDEDDHDAAAVIVNFDLALVKTIDTAATPSPLERGDDITYEITILNQGARSVWEVDVTDTFDIALFADFDTSKNPAGSTTDIGGDADTIDYAFVDNGGGSVTIELSGDSLDPSESVTVPLVLTARPTLAAQTVLTNLAEISRFDNDDDPGNGDSTDPDPNNPIRDDDSTPNDDPTDDGDPIDDEVDGERGGDPDDEDDHDPAEVTVDVFDLAIRKRSVDITPMPTLPGTSKVTFEIEVFNQGTINATDVVITDYIQPGFTFLAADNQPTPNRNNTWTGADGDTAVTTVIPQIFFDRSITVEIVLLLEVEPFDEFDRINYAEVSAADDDGDTLTDPPTDIDSTPDAVNDEAAANLEDDELDEDALTPGPDTSGDGTVDEDDHDVAVIELPSFDLALRKTIDTAATNVIAPGGDVTFTIEVFNQGDLAANDITVVDYLPAGFTVSPADANSWTGTSGDVTNVIAGPIAPGASATVDIVARIGDVTGELVNTAEIVSAEDDNDVERRDVDSTPDATNDDVDPVDDEIDNGGGDEDDHDIETLEILPSSLGDIVWLDVNRDGLLGPGEPGVPDVTVELLDAAGAMLETTTTDADGEYAFVDLVPATYSVRFALSTLPEGHDLTQQNVGGDDALDSDADPTTGQTAPTDLDPGEDDPTLDAGVVLPEFDLGAIKIADEVNVAGRSITWLVTATNVGPGRAIGPITITDELPDYLTFVEVRNTTGDCTSAGQTVTCVFNGDLAAGGALTAEIVTTVAPGVTSVSNTIVVTSPFSAFGQLGATPDQATAALPFGGALPATGSTVWMTLLRGAAVLLLGVGLVVAARRRRALSVTIS